jgi:hypothetical protein
MIGMFACCLIVALNKPIHDKSTISAITLIVLVVLLIFPIGGLFGFHLVLISNGRTTNEHVTGKYRGNNFFSRGFCRNFLHLFCGSLTPQLKPIKISNKKKGANNDDNNNLIIDMNQFTSADNSKLKIGSISDNDSMDDEENDEDDEEKDVNVQTNNNNNTSNRKDPELLDIVLKNMKSYKNNRRTSVSSNDSITSASMLNTNNNNNTNIKT